MMFLHTLRLAGDLSFYYAFAGFFAASFGGTPMPLVLVWPALCFGLASCFEGSRLLRTTLAALSAAALLFLPAGADKLCYFPAAVYPVLLAYTGDFALSPVRQAERLRWLCRVWPFFAVAMLLWNANAVLSAALPFATAAAVLLVGFNRTTRQDPEISTRPGYLLLSGGVLAAVCAGPFLLSRSVVVAGAKAAASAVYFGGIVPVLQLFLNNIVVQGVTWLCLLYTSPSPRDRTRRRTAHQRDVDADCARYPAGGPLCGAGGAAFPAPEVPAHGHCLHGHHCPA